MSGNSKIIILVLIVAVLFSSSIGGGVAAWLNWDKLFPSTEEDSPSPSTNTNTNTGGPTGGGPTGGATVTINGETFDPSGFTVSKGFIANTVQIGTNSIEDINACRDKCINNSECIQFKRSADGTCTILKSGDAANDAVSVAGFKNDGNNLYTKESMIGTYEDSASYGDASKRVTYTTAQCKNKCATSPSCIAWYHRNSTHGDAASKNTCVTFAESNVPAASRYRYGAVGK